MSSKSGDYGEDDKVKELVDSSIPIRKYFGGCEKRVNKKLLSVSVTGIKDVNQFYAVTVVTQFLL